MGIIPAYAGNTKRLSWFCAQIRDHPRVCGEHGILDKGMPLTAGSSPRMRGTHTSRQYLRADFGIIPAYAGNTSWRQILRSSTRDHPRVCGEH